MKLQQTLLHDLQVSQQTIKEKDICISQLQGTVCKLVLSDNNYTTVSVNELQIQKDTHIAQLTQQGICDIICVIM